MKYTVPVYFQVSGKDAPQAAAKIKARLEGHELGFAFKVGEPESHSIPKNVKISFELRNFLHAEIQANDSDTSGHNTDLDYAKSSLEQMPDDVVIEQCGCIILPDIGTELDKLIKRLGWTTQCGDLVELFDAANPV